MRQIVLDTETTGIGAEAGHRIIEIGCVELFDRELTGKHFHYYLNPQRAVDEGAFRVHGLSNEFLKDKPLFTNIVNELIAFIDESELIIHNAPFDLKFLIAELTRLGREPRASFCSGVTDSLAHAKTLHPGKSNSLDALCDRYGVSNAHRTLHGALLDSRLLAEVWLAMTRGQDSLMIDQFDAPETEGVEANEQRLEALNLRVILPSAEDLHAHEQYMTALDKAVKGACVWRQYETRPE